METGKLNLMTPYYPFPFLIDVFLLAVMDFINGKNYAVPVEKVPTNLFSYIVEIFHYF